MSEQNYRYQLIDTETVGLKPFEHGAGVCEVSIRDVCPETTDTNFELYSLLNPEGPISPSASGVHLITNEQVADKPLIADWLKGEAGDPWGADKQPVYFIAHNAPFDLRFLKPYIECEYKVVDTLVLARRYFTDAEDHKLQTLRYHLQLNELADPEELQDAHSASGDTQTLLLLVRYLIGFTGMSLQELCEDAQVRDPLTKMPFGKYKGRTFDSIQKENPGYFTWCLKNFEDIDPELEKAIKAAQGK